MPTAVVASDTRAIQKMSVLLRNKISETEEYRIEFTPNTFCAGINCLSNSALPDPGQGDTPFIGGRLPSAGQYATVYGSTKAWRSCGPSTQLVAFDELKWFCYTIEWGDFKELLRQITVAQEGNGASVSEKFGEGWDDPLSWELKAARFGQEVYNPAWSLGTSTYIGGYTSYFQVDTIWSKHGVFVPIVIRP